MTKWKFDKGRLIFFSVLCVLYAIFMIWLYQHPEYTTYIPSEVIKQSDGRLIYFHKNCSREINFEPFKDQYSNCDLQITDVPPAYYIHQWYLKYQSYIFWGSLIYSILWALMNWDKIKYWFKSIDNFVNKNDNKQNKKRKSR
jgi:hypothetical protein